MDLDEMICRARQRSDDATPQPFVDDDTWALWASEAEKEACLRASLIYDHTSAFCSIAIQPNIIEYPLDERILRIDENNVHWIRTNSPRHRDVEMVGIDQLRHRFTCYGHEFCGNRVEHATHMGKTLHVWPRPSSTISGVLTFGVYRLPLDCMEDGSDEPEIPVEHHEGLINWMLYRAYSSKDPELNDPTAAATALGLFTAQFGERPSADTMRQHNERRRHSAPYGGY